MHATLVFPTAEPLQIGDLVMINEGGRLVKWRADSKGDCLGALPPETRCEADHITVPMHTLDSAPFPVLTRLQAMFEASTMKQSHIKRTEARDIAFGPCPQWPGTDWCVWPECDCVSHSCARSRELVIECERSRKLVLEEGTDWPVLFWVVVFFGFMVAYIFRRNLGL